jgi:hypothetical protein
MQSFIDCEICLADGTLHLFVAKRKTSRIPELFLRCLNDHHQPLAEASRIEIMIKKKAKLFQPLWSTFQVVRR